MGKFLKNILTVIFNYIVPCLGFLALVAAWLANLPFYQLMLVLVAATTLSLLGISQINQLISSKVKSLSKMNDVELESVICDWLIQSKFKIQKLGIEGIDVFRYSIDFNNGFKVEIVKNNQQPGIVTACMSLDFSTTISPLPKSEKEHRVNSINIEMVRLGIQYNWGEAESNYRNLVMFQAIPIVDGLTVHEFRLQVMMVQRALILSNLIGQNLV
jgi:hypothetical protein